MVTRLAACEQAHEQAVRQWLASLSDAKMGALIDDVYGAGTWDWLCAETDTMTLEEIEYPGELWGRFFRWREAQP